MHPLTLKELKYVAFLLPNIEYYVLTGYDYQPEIWHDNYIKILPFEKLNRFYIDIKNLHKHFKIHNKDASKTYSYRLENESESPGLIPYILVEQENTRRTAGEWTSSIDCYTETRIVFFNNTGGFKWVATRLY